jgi:hypothetical protein
MYFERKLLGYKINIYNKIKIIIYVEKVANKRLLTYTNILIFKH